MWDLIKEVFFNLEASWDVKNQSYWIHIAFFLFVFLRYFAKVFISSQSNRFPKFWFTLTKRLDSRDKLWSDENAIFWLFKRSKSSNIGNVWCSTNCCGLSRSLPRYVQWIWGVKMSNKAYWWVFTFVFLCSDSSYRSFIILESRVIPLSFSEGMRKTLDAF